LILDRLSSVAITVVGLSVILAVAGMMLFLIGSSLPLFKKETLEPSGKLEKVISAGGFSAGELLFDDNAPIGFLLPAAESNGCKITARSVSQSKANPHTSADVFQNFILAKNIATSADPANLPLNLKRMTADAQSAADVTCSAQGDGRILVRDGQRLHFGQIKILRTFISGEDFRALPADKRQALSENNWTVSNDEILVKPSKQSPAAKLSLQFEIEWSLADFFSQYPSLNLNNLHFVRKPGKAGGVFVINPNVRPSPAQNAVSSTLPRKYILLNQSENTLTGERSTTLAEILHTENVQDSKYAQWNPAWIEGRYLLLPHSATSFRVIDTEDAQMSSAILTLPEELGSLSTLSANFGGAAVFTETQTSGKTLCASLDAGRGSRLAFGTTGLQLAIPVLWIDQCAASARLISHPHQRAVYRFLVANGETENATLEARELTTGRIASTVAVPAAARLSAVIDSKGYLLGWNDAETDNMSLLKFNAPHLEVSLRSLFGKIRYESYENASYSWQSTSGTDEFQAKFSLIPLIWGTIKATLYSLLFAVPLAIFAAVYSSEILDRQTRNVVKPTLEMMASIPSVVLGFLAAIVIAPWIEEHIVSVLLIGVSMPFMLYAAGVFMQVPSARHLTTRGLYASRRLLMWVIGGFAISIWLLGKSGMWIERTAFGGDLKAFLSGGAGTEGVLWGLLFLPLVFISLWSIPVRRARNWYRIAVFILGPVVSVWLGSVLSGHTTLRNDLLGQYAQRNTLVISIAMGFAIIPIIYSLAEDALTSVPSSLRAGSLACGASVWQTTARVVLPTAASGLFSAVMVGLGRGIGETMIVVMATGNTAVMTLNPFDGLRSMAANIAVELPEAAQGSTHYRILFLSALVLFMFTFTLNSFAEFLRARYRARNKAL
jgi:ABC-type uncharacterized transport system permease subunit